MPVKRKFSSWNAWASRLIAELTTPCALRPAPIRSWYAWRAAAAWLPRLVPALRRYAVSAVAASSQPPGRTATSGGEESGITRVRLGAGGWGVLDSGGGLEVGGSGGVVTRSGDDDCEGGVVTTTSAWGGGGGAGGTR